MKNKKKSVSVHIKALRKLLGSLSRFPKSKKINLRNTALATLAVVLVAGIFAVSPKLQSYFKSQPSQASGGGRETKLTPPYSKSPRIHNNRVVFEVIKPYPGGDLDIYMYDLMTKSYTTISAGPGEQLQPDIYDNKIVYKDVQIYSTNIMLYDLSTHKTINISNNPANEPGKMILSGSPTIYGHRVAWKNSIFESGGVPESYQEIVLYDITTGQKNVVSQFETDTSYYAGKEVDMFDNIIVWSDQRTGTLRIYIYNIETGEESMLTLNGNLNQITPAIYGQRIIWQEGTYYNNAGIQMYDLITHQEYQITDRGYFPEIDKTMIVWESYTGNYDYNIYMHKISDPIGVNYQITDNEAHQGDADIFANKIVWEDSRDEGWPNLGIYMFELLSSTAHPDR